MKTAATTISCSTATQIEVIASSLLLFVAHVCLLRILLCVHIYHDY
jgi:hypothetical protein